MSRSTSTSGGGAAGRSTATPRAGGSYRALAGISFPGGRLEPGDVTDRLPGESVGWLLDGGYIEPAEEVTGDAG